MPKVYLETIQFNSKAIAKRKKKVIQDLDAFDEEEISLPSSFVETKKEKKKKKEVIDTDEYLDSDWMNALVDFKVPKAKKRGKIFDDLEDTGKKKKKKKKKDGAISHKKDFEPEMALLRNLQMEQTKFVDSLQKKYDQIEGTKASARGVSKFTTDLIETITAGRSLSMQLVDKIISAKKTIADLDFKERKEFGSANNAQQDLNNYASTYLKQIVSSGRNNLVAGDSSTYVEDIDDDDDLLSSIEDTLTSSEDYEERDRDVDLYLKYENDNVSVKVIWYDDKDCEDMRDQYEFVAYKSNGEEVDDYPLPEKTKLFLNRSTSKCTDTYGNKYDLIVI